MENTLIVGLNTGLLSVAAVAALLISVGFVVFSSDMKSVTHRAFFALTGASVVWSLFNYAIYQSSDTIVVLWLLRFIMFSATWFAFALFTFFFVFPNREYAFPVWYRYILLPVTVAVSLLTLTPFVFEAIASFSATGQVEQVANGFGIFVFGAFASILDFSAIFLFIRKTLQARGSAGSPYRLILVGIIVTILLIIVFSFIFPAFLGNSSLVEYGTLFLLPFIILTAYTIYHDRILNVKEIATAVLVSMLATAALVEVIFTTNPILILFRTSLFVLILLVGLLLVRGVVREVQQREKIEKLAEELSKTNSRQETLIHFIGHEVKGFLTKAAGTFSAMIEGDLGEMPPTMKEFAERALADTRHGVRSVSDILKASNLKKGTVEFKKEPFDLRALVAEAVERARPTAEGKGLTFSFDAAPGEYQAVGDREELGDHVLRNLIDNSINYTPSGSISISLARVADKFVFTIRDTGVGISDEDKAHLFTEGGHGKDSVRVNANSTGFGLYIAKDIVTAQGGTIRAESAGAGQGSTFIVELPA